MGESGTERLFDVHMPSAKFTVSPGERLSIPVLLYSTHDESQDLIVSVRGVPSQWVTMPSSDVHLAPGEQQEILIMLEPPAYPYGHAGRYTLDVRVAKKPPSTEVVEKTSSLTVAAVEVPGRVGVLMAANDFSVLPGQSVSIPVVLLNQGIGADTFTFSVDGIPESWVYAPSATVSLAPGKQQEMVFSLDPPRSTHVRAGRHPFIIKISSAAMAGHATEVPCILTLGPVTGFHSELRPERIQAGRPADLAIENRGNIPQAFTVAWESTNDEVLFESETEQPVRVPPGETGHIEFTARPRHRPLLGNEIDRAFAARVEAQDEEVRKVNGQVVTRGWLPGWLIPAVGIALAAVVGIVLLTAFLESRAAAKDPSAPPPTEAPADPPAQDPPAQEPPAQEPPVEEPPAEDPPAQDPPAQDPPAQEPPVEEPPAEEPPAEEPPAQDPPAQEPPAEDPPGEGGGELPCIPAALALVVAPLFLLTRHTRKIV